jgi:hypothetical protein
MTDPEPSVAFWATMFAIVPLLFVAYLGLYVWLVVPFRFLGYGTGLEPEPPCVIDTYRGGVNRRLAVEFFGPANWLDRRVRPELWKAD